MCRLFRQRNGPFGVCLHGVCLRNVFLRGFRLRSVFLLHGLIGVVVLPGCAWVRAQAQHRSTECEELCAQADREQEAGRVERADQLLDFALKKSPRDVEIQRQLADSLWQVGRQRESLAQLARIAEEHPQDLRLALKLAERYAELDQHEESLNWIAVVLRNEPTSIAGMTLKAQNELAQGQDAAALATYQRISQQEAGQAAALLAMGEIHLRRGQPERAAPLLRSALVHPRATTQERITAQWELGVAYAQAERWSDAAAELMQVADRRVMTPDDWHSLAYAEFRCGQLPAAQAALDRALFLEPRHTAALELAAGLQQSQLRTPDASTALLPASFERQDIRLRQPLP